MVCKYLHVDGKKATCINPTKKDVCCKTRLKYHISQFCFQMKYMKLQSLSDEHSEKQPPHNSDLARQKDKLKLITRDTSQPSNDPVGTFSQNREITPIPQKSPSPADDNYKMSDASKKENNTMAGTPDKPHNPDLLSHSPPDQSPAILTTVLGKEPFVSSTINQHTPRR